MSGQTPAPNDWCVTTTAELAELQRLRSVNAELIKSLEIVSRHCKDGFLGALARTAIADAEKQS